MYLYDSYGILTFTVMSKCYFEHVLRINLEFLKNVCSFVFLNNIMYISANCLEFKVENQDSKLQNCINSAFKFPHRLKINLMICQTKYFYS